MGTDHRWMLYGATGYTGQLLAEEAVRRGLRPVLAGRNPDKLAALGGRLQLETVAVELEDAAALRRAVDGCAVVFHAAGPFVRTAAPMREACLDARAHYVDITGELPVLEASFASHARAIDRGVCVVSAVGFDVVPTDCLAVHVAQKLPGATQLEIAIAATGGISRGTMKSALGLMGEGIQVRRDGRIATRRLGEGVRRVRFSSREVWAMPAPLGDLSTGYRSTGIGNISTYLAVPSGLGKAMRTLSPLLGLSGPVVRAAAASSFVQKALGKWVETRAEGPTEEARGAGKSYAWARVTRPSGEQAEAWLECIEAYTFTAQAGIRVVEALLARPRSDQTGALSPAQAFGADFVLQVPGTRRLDGLP